MKPMKNKDEIPTKPALVDFLQEKRKEKSFSLERLSELTRIQVYHLQALEAGEFDKLPPAVYRKGIFKRLSKFLDLDENEILAMYKNENPIIEEPSYANSVAVSKENSYFILTPKKLMVFFGGMLLILISAYLWYQFNFLIGPPNLVIKPSEDAITKEETILVSGKTDSGINLTINGENTYVGPNGSFEKSIKLAAGVNIVEIKAVNGFDKVTKVIRQIFRETQ